MKPDKDQPVAAEQQLEIPIPHDVGSCVFCGAFVYVWKNCSVHNKHKHSESELQRMLRLRKELEPDAPDTIVTGPAPEAGGEAELWYREFVEWFDKEDYGDREQLKRAWVAAIRWANTRALQPAGEPTWQRLRELLNHYTLPCLGNCEHSHCPLLKELWLMMEEERIKVALEGAQKTVQPLIDAEKKCEDVGDIMDMRLQTAQPSPSIDARERAREIVIETIWPTNSSLESEHCNCESTMCEHWQAELTDRIASALLSIGKGGT